MAKSKETWNKQEAEKKKEKKKKEKEQKKEERRANAKEGGKSFDDMIAYIDENGNITSTPPDPTKKKTIKAEDIQIGVPKQDNTKQLETVKTGIVTFFNDSKGYGFIKDMETQDSVFVHMKGLIDPIKENNKVTFEVEMGHKGPNAVNVKLSK